MQGGGAQAATLTAAAKTVQRPGGADDSARPGGPAVEEKRGARPAALDSIKVDALGFEVAQGLPIVPQMVVIMPTRRTCQQRSGNYESILIAIVTYTERVIRVSDAPKHLVEW